MPISDVIFPDGERRERAGELSHKRFIPWQLTKDDSYDGIANGLRAWSATSQGSEVTHPGSLSNLRKLRQHLATHNLVVDYDRREALLTGCGWKLVPRDPKIDDPDLPIRRPTE